MSGLFGYSADCLADDCEHCEQPDGCDCDCHLDDDSGDDDYPWPADPYDWRPVETVQVPVLAAPAGESA